MSGILSIPFSENSIPIEFDEINSIQNMIDMNDLYNIEEIKDEKIEIDRKADTFQRILIVDDSSNNIFVLELLLNKLNISHHSVIYINYFFNFCSQNTLYYIYIYI